MRSFFFTFAPTKSYYKMKKYIVLFCLFVIPIVAYLFFASGVNTFSILPTHKNNIEELGNWKSLNGNPIKLQNNITILGFSGTDVIKNQGNFFNLNQKIYQRYHEFDDLQFVFISPLGTEDQVKLLLSKLEVITDIKDWQFVFATPEEISSYYQKLDLKIDTLSPQFGTPNVYLIDKERNLRGRKVQNEKEYKEGYDTSLVSILSNEFLDDLKIILFEYRAAVKKNNNSSQRLHKSN